MNRNASPSCHRYVDMWVAPGVHASNIEVLQKLKSADSQHFTTNMDVIGTVSEMDDDSGKWQQSHLVGLRTDAWRPTKQEAATALTRLQKKRKQELKAQIRRSGRLTKDESIQLQHQLEQDAVMSMGTDDMVQRRLVIKLFKNTGKRLRWCGTIEELTTTEIHNSIGSNRILLTMAVMLPRIEFVTRIQQNHRTFRVPSIFTMCFHHEHKMWHLSVKRRWFSLGADYDVEANGESIGQVDGKLVSWGSDSYLDLEDHELAGDTEFADLMTLFTASVGYHRSMRRSVKRRVNAIEAGESHRHVIEDEELRLRHNGRAAA